jgi:solute carrier family 25 protein 33/36
LGLRKTFATIYKEEGMVALYGGLTQLILMRVVPNAAILFFCYELIVDFGLTAAQEGQKLDTWRLVNPILES